MTTDVTSFHSSVPTEFYRWAPIDDARLAFIKQTIARGASDIELQEFVNLCDNLHLSPFTRPQQIWFIKRREMVDGQWKDAFSVQIGIAGKRAIAARTGLYLGSTQPEWCGQPRDPDAEPVWRSAWLFDEPPAAARVGVWIRGAPLPTFRVATWREFAQWHKRGESQVLNNLWQKYPSYMLAKCAESAALSAAFPEETAGAERYFSLDDGPRVEVIEDRPRQSISTPSRAQLAAPLDAVYTPEPPEVVPMRAMDVTPDPTQPQSRMSQAAGIPVKLTAAEFGEQARALGFPDRASIATGLGATVGRDPGDAIAKWFNANGRSWELALRVLRGAAAPAAEPEAGDGLPDAEPCPTCEGLVVSGVCPNCTPPADDPAQGELALGARAERAAAARGSH